MSRRHEDRASNSARGRGSGGGPKRRPGPSRSRPAPGQARRPRHSSRRHQGLVVTPAKKSLAAETDDKVRLNHFLAMCGLCSRRAADELIEAGRIEINGELVRTLGVRVDPLEDDVRFDGQRVKPERPVYVLFNKPKGVVCTNARNEQKKRVIDFLPTVRGRLFTVGRLDLESEGLILLTNDGSFALEMTHPRYGVPKLYSVVLRGRVTDADLEKARGGVWLAEGPTAGMQVRIDRVTRDRTYLKVTLREGKNREIRRVFAKSDHPVVALKRIRIGPLTLHGLGTAKWRFLQAHEVEELRRTARGDELGEDQE